MAIVLAGPLGLDMSQPGYFLGGTVLLANTTTIAVQLNNGVEDVYFGSFQYSGNSLTGGTINELDSYYSVGGTLWYAVGGFSLPVSTYFSYANANDWFGLQTSVLS